MELYAFIVTAALVVLSAGTLAAVTGTWLSNRATHRSEDVLARVIEWHSRPSRTPAEIDWDRHVEDALRAAGGQR